MWRRPGSPIFSWIFAFLGDSSFGAVASFRKVSGKLLTTEAKGAGVSGSVPGLHLALHRLMGAVAAWDAWSECDNSQL